MLCSIILNLWRRLYGNKLQFSYQVAQGFCYFYLLNYFYCTWLQDIMVIFPVGNWHMYITHFNFFCPPKCSYQWEIHQTPEWSLFCCLLMTSVFSKSCSKLCYSKWQPRATCHYLNLTELKLQLPFLWPSAMFRVLKSHMCPEPTVLNGMGREHVHHQRKFCGSRLLCRLQRYWWIYKQWRIFQGLTLSDRSWLPKANLIEMASNNH